MSLNKYNIGNVCDTMTLYACLTSLLEWSFMYCNYAKGRSFLLSNFCNINLLDVSLEIDINTFMKCATMPIKRLTIEKLEISGLISKICNGCIQYGLDVVFGCVRSRKICAFPILSQQRSTIYLKACSNFIIMFVHPSLANLWINFIS